MSTASAQLESEMQSGIKREGAGRGMEWRRAKSANGRLLAGNTMAQMEGGGGGKRVGQME